MTKQSFFRGAFILSMAGLLSKILGAFYRIPFSHMVGPEGIGLYQMAYPIYTMLLALSTAGIPVAISKMVAENAAQGNFRGARKILRLALVILAVVGAACSFLLILSAKFLAFQVVKDPRAYYSIVAIAPAIFFVAVMSVFRGYFQGLQRMGPTAFSQVIEQIFRVGTVFIGAYIFLSEGVALAAAAATFGAVTGAIAGLLFLILIYIREKNGNNNNGLAQQPRKFSIITNMVFLALPISLGGLVMPLMQTIDAVIVPMRLQDAGFTVAQATGLYGQLSGMAAILANLPTVITLALATALVPAISQALVVGNYSMLHRQAGGAVRLTILICLPAALGLGILAEPLSSLLFNCPEAGIPLMMLAPGTLFLGLHQATSGILQGLGKTYIPVGNLLIGALFKLGCNYVLTAVPSLGIKGAALGTVIGFALASLLNFRAVIKEIGWTVDIVEHLLKPLFAATMMAIVVIFSLKAGVTQNNSLGVLWVIMNGFCAYILALVIVGGIKSRDLHFIPGLGPALAGLLTRIGIVRR